MMHGNAGQASDRDYVLGHLSDHDSLYVLEYPGYGDRSGSPSKTSIDAAAQQAFNELRTIYPQKPVCVIGESIGSGPAAMLASSTQPPEKLVLITPFDSLYRVAARRFFFLPVWLLLLDRWDNMTALRDYQGDVDIYGAQDDTIIPVHHARSLAQACKNAKFHLIPGGHNDWSFGKRGQVSFSRTSSVSHANPDGK
ncbi:MAG: alpha/beta fold hydrolase [Pirellulaceae bacterium]|nr:alpha/beta fold hydrolase [Pirellulaceae bacterium]